MQCCDGYRDGYVLQIMSVCVRVMMYMDHVSALLYVARQGKRVRGVLVTMQVASLQAGERGGGKGEKWYDGNRVPAKAPSSGAIPPKNQRPGL